MVILKAVWCDFLDFFLWSCFRFHLFSTQSPNSPVLLIHSEYHQKNQDHHLKRMKGLSAGEMLAGVFISVLVVFSLRLCVVGGSSSVSIHSSSMRMVVCSFRRLKFCMYCMVGLWKEYSYAMFFYLFLNRKHEAIIFCAVKCAVCLGQIQLDPNDLAHYFI